MRNSRPNALLGVHHLGVVRGLRPRSLMSCRCVRLCVCTYKAESGSGKFISPRLESRRKQSGPFVEPIKWACTTGLLA